MKKNFAPETPFIKDRLGLLNESYVEKNIRILPFLKDLIPPLSDDELTGLEESIFQEGIKHPLILWETTLSAIASEEVSLIPAAWREEAGIDPEKKIYILIDGHHRYALSQKLGKPFRYTLQNFSSVEEVEEYMIKFQLSRRNLTPLQTSSLRGRLYLKFKRQYEGSSLEKLPTQPPEENPDQTLTDDIQQAMLQEKRRGTGDTSPKGKGSRAIRPINDKGRLAEQLAGQFGVSDKTIQRDAEFQRGLEKLTQPLRQQIIAGKVKVNKSDVSALGKMEGLPEKIDTEDGLLLAIQSNAEAPIAPKKIESRKTSTPPQQKSSAAESNPSLEKTLLTLDTLEQEIPELIRQHQGQPNIQEQIVARLSNLLKLVKSE